MFLGIVLHSIGDLISLADLPAPVAPVPAHHTPLPESQPLPHDTGPDHNRSQVMEAIGPVTSRPPPSNIFDQARDPIVPEHPAFASSYTIDQSTPMIPEHPAFASSYTIDQLIDSTIPGNPAYASGYPIDPTFHLTPSDHTLFGPG